jgi:hypothetical protein
MLAKDKQALFDQHSDPEIKKLMKSMGGPDNFINHFRITPAEFYNVYPEMANKKGMPVQQNAMPPPVNQQPTYYQP